MAVTNWSPICQCLLLSRNRILNTFFKLIIFPGQFSLLSHCFYFILFYFWESIKQWAISYQGKDIVKKHNSIAVFNREPLHFNDEEVLKRFFICMSSQLICLICKYVFNGKDLNKAILSHKSTLAVFV